MQHLQQLTIEAGEIAEALSLTRPYFLRLVPTLIRNHAMPARLPGRRRWSRPAIERWLATYSEHKAADAALPAPVLEQRAALYQAYANNNAPASTQAGARA